MFEKTISGIGFIFAKIAIFLIIVYKYSLSFFVGGNCRFFPTCSDYAIEAIRKTGFFVGIIIAVRRIVRCNPFFEGGYDPVSLRHLRERQQNNKFKIT